jgi:hypothetical protein
MAGVLLATAGLYAQGFSTKIGQHVGEVKQLQVSTEFSGAVGKTVTDAQGTHFYIGRSVVTEPQVYPPKYWGEFLLYYIGSRVGVTVTATNQGPRQTAKLLIRTEAYVLNTDGSNGAQLKPPADIEVIISRGETKTIDASFVVPYTSDLTSGLDRFVVKVMHPNSGGGPGNPEPATILVSEGIFCPPGFGGTK